MATVQGRDELRKNAPNKGFLCVLVSLGQVSNHTAQVTVATVLHVQVQVLRGFEVLAVIVSNNVDMAQRRKNLKFRVQLFSLFLGHLEVADFFAAEHHAVSLAADLADHAK